MAVKFAILGVGNMASAIISGIIKSSVDIDKIFLFDKNVEQYERVPKFESYVISDSISAAVEAADVVLLSVKPQNYSDVLEDIRKSVSFEKKLYVSIAAGITSEAVSAALNGACVVRVLPNLPMTLGLGVSAICQSPSASRADFELVCDIFRSSGSVLIIDESEINRIVGVTSSSPAYVFKFIDAIYKGALEQLLPTDGLIEAICDVFIGSATLLKESGESPETLIARVASKGGTTEKALEVLDDSDIYGTVLKAMTACTKRADELGDHKH